MRLGRQLLFACFGGLRLSGKTPNSLSENTKYGLLSSKYGDLLTLHPNKPLTKMSTILSSI